MRRDDSFAAAVCQALYCMSRSTAPRSPRPSKPQVATRPPAKKSVRTRASGKGTKGKPAAPKGNGHDRLLAALGDRVRSLRARRGLTRKAVALSAGVSERHLANLEYGIGNASILILQ
ncbi:MAG TPA: helix-turn-helix domain-containing protein, partial [Burkholderiaceae bacterium]|nr:helix-turn-helix domain-containing protein [Burkholderiaceae bacterium]